MITLTNDRDKIGQISSALMKIHKLILEHLMEAREQATQTQIPPNERLNLLLNDPEFAWLRTLSQMMAYVDEIYFQKEAILESQVEDIYNKVDGLFSLQNESEFTYRYKQAVVTIPDLMMAHGLLKVALKAAKTVVN